MSEPRAPYVVATQHVARDPGIPCRERIQAIRSAGWLLLGIAVALEAGETPTHMVAEVIERLERIRIATEGRDGPAAGDCRGAGPGGTT